MTSTLYLVGFPSDASERELENFCRFLPGYVGATAAFTKGPMVWVRFENPSRARAALSCVDGQPFNLNDPSSAIRAEIARSDTNPRTTADGYSQFAPVTTLAPTGKGKQRGPAAVVGPNPDLKNMLATLVKHDGPVSRGDWGSPPAPKRKRVEASGVENDTLVLFGIGEKGYTEDDLTTFFQQIDGYVILSCTNPNGKGGGNCFIKFDSPDAAGNAIEIAKFSQLELEPARTSLNVPGMTSYEPKGGKGKSWAPQGRASSYEDGEMDTLVVFKLEEKSVTEEELQYAVFGQMDGFIGLQTAGGSGGGNCFIKFGSAEQAKAAMETSPEELNVQLARRSLNLRS